MRTVLFKFPQTLADELDKVAAKNDRTRAAQVRHYIREGLRRDGVTTDDLDADAEPQRAS